MKNKRYLLSGFAVLQLIITLGLADAFFFNLLLESNKDIISAIVFIYIVCQFLKTVISRKRYAYNYIYFAGIAGVLALYYSSFSVTDNVGVLIQFGIITTFMAVPLIDLFSKDKLVVK